MKTLIPTFIASIVFSLCPLHADGPMIGPDRLYSDGPVVLLRLTEEQKAFLEKEHKSRTESALRLSPEQTQKIETGFNIKTTFLEVWDTRKHDTDCSCASSNIALRFSEDYIEVLQSYLRTDADAIAKWKSWDEIQ